MVTKKAIELIGINSIFLDDQNPRHEPLTSQPEIIEHLCKDELILQLAEHIAAHDMNPLDSIGLLEVTKKGVRRKVYIVREGNRRVCALKLLNDPNLAPANLRKSFERLSKENSVPTKVSSIVFDNKKELDLWMGVTHGGGQTGIGRRTWDAEQKARFTGENKNKLAQAILDYAEDKGFITAEQRRRKLTTVQRHLSNNVVREALGVEQHFEDQIQINRPKKDFNLLLKKFVDDLKSGTVNSRNNKKQIDPYGRKLSSLSSVSGRRTSPTLLNSSSTHKKKSLSSTSPKKPIKPTKISYDEEINSELEKLGNSKLESLYYSICQVSAEDHSPLVTVGAWSFIESVTAFAGRQENTDFVTFFNGGYFQILGYKNKKKTGPIRDALERLQKNGNSTKHHKSSAMFDHGQLINDIETITPVVLDTLKSLNAK